MAAAAATIDGAVVRAAQAGAPAAARASAARAHRLSGALGLPVLRRRRLRKLGEDVTETLELVPRQWKVIQHVREKFSCRACEAITQPPAPSHPIARGRAGPKLLAHVLFAKYGLHLPLNRQSAVYAREGIDLDVSTLADWVGAAAATLMPLVEAIRAHVFAAERIHADDTTVPVLAKGKTRTGRLWTYVRDDRPFGGPDPPAAVFFYSPRSRRRASRAASGELCRADAGRRLCRLQPALRGRPQAGADHRGGVLGACAAQVLRPGAAQQGADRDRGGRAHRCAVRHRARDQRPAAAGAPGACATSAAGRSSIALEAWLREQRARLSGNSETAKAIDYSLKRWAALTRFLDDGRLCMSNNAAERALRGIAVGRKQLDLRRLRRRRPARRRHLHADRDRQAQRRRSAGLARRRARPPAGSSRQAHRRAAALELAPTEHRRCKPPERATPPVQTGLPRGLHRMRTATAGRPGRDPAADAGRDGRRGARPRAAPGDLHADLLRVRGAGDRRPPERLRGDRADHGRRLPPARHVGAAEGRRRRGGRDGAVGPSCRRGPARPATGVDDAVDRTAATAGGTSRSRRDRPRHAPDAADTDPETPYMLIYTSGTTGRPKGAVHVHGGFPIKGAQDLAHQFDLGRATRCSGSPTSAG